uniref:Uncharacterized protein n=1 Tax=Vitis vinifera TaxID=29760 RepID=F6I1F4_VITVI
MTTQPAIIYKALQKGISSGQIVACITLSS